MKHHLNVLIQGFLLLLCIFSSNALSRTSSEKAYYGRSYSCDYINSTKLHGEAILEWVCLNDEDHDSNKILILSVSKDPSYAIDPNNFLSPFIKQTLSLRCNIERDFVLDVHEAYGEVDKFIVKNAFSPIHGRLSNYPSFEFKSSEKGVEENGFEMECMLLIQNRDKTLSPIVIDFEDSDSYRYYLDLVEPSTTYSSFFERRGHRELWNADGFLVESIPNNFFESPYRHTSKNAAFFLNQPWDEHAYVYLDLHVNHLLSKIYDEYEAPLQSPSAVSGFKPGQKLFYVDLQNQDPLWLLGNVFDSGWDVQTQKTALSLSIYGAGQNVLKIPDIDTLYFQDIGHSFLSPLSDQEQAELIGKALCMLKIHVSESNPLNIKLFSAFARHPRYYETLMAFLSSPACRGPQSPRIEKGPRQHTSIGRKAFLDRVRSGSAIQKNQGEYVMFFSMAYPETFAAWLREPILDESTYTQLLDLWFSVRVKPLPRLAPIFNFANFQMAQQMYLALQENEKQHLNRLIQTHQLSWVNNDTVDEFLGSLLFLIPLSKESRQN